LGDHHCRIIKRLQGGSAFVLTGALLENELEELFSVVEFVVGRQLGPLALQDADLGRNTARNEKPGCSWTHSFMCIPFFMNGHGKRKFDGQIISLVSLDRPSAPD
jgi:hypothetical protein